MDVDALFDEVRRRRRAGEVIVWLRPHDAATAEHALRGLLREPPAPLVPGVEPDELTEIAPEQAQHVLERVLARDLAYGAKLMRERRAVRLAGSLVATLPEPARWWTNGGLLLDERIRSWNPLTPATFDTGVIGVSRDDLLLAWFTDED